MRTMAGRAGRAMVAVVAMAMGSPAPALADFSSLRAAASGVAVDGPLPSAPEPTVTLQTNPQAPPAASGPFLQSSPGVNVAKLFTTGPITVGARAAGVADGDHLGFVEATAIIERPSLVGPEVAVAERLTTTCVAAAGGSTGRTLIEGGTLFGRPVDREPAPNTVVDLPGVGTVTLNQQSLTNAGGLTRLRVRAVHAVSTTSFGIGVLPRDVRIEAIVGEVECEAVGHAVNQPPPTTVPPSTTTTVGPPDATSSPPRGALPRTGGFSSLAAGIGLVVAGVGSLHAARGRGDRWRRPSRRARRQERP